MRFVLPIPPVPQGRPRAYRRGRHVGVYDPPESSAFKAQVRHLAQSAGVPLLTGPVSVSLHFFVPRTAALMARRQPETAIPCAKRPDLDNYVKAVLDGLNGVAWKDDGQVWDLRAAKWYCEKTGRARIEVEIL
jgi:Holliday junction resolvase RusA-like endonuclease